MDIKNIILSEHENENIIYSGVDSNVFDDIKNFEFVKPSKIWDGVYPYTLKYYSNHLEIQAGYYVGLDWIFPNKYTLSIEPKVNSTLSDVYNNLDKTEQADFTGETRFEFVQVDYLQMLLNVCQSDISAKYLDDLFTVLWEKPAIPILQSEDKLTPFLIVKYLALLRKIVKKGLRKAYFQEKYNLKHKVKGKIMLAENIKRNLFRNKKEFNVCNYQVFGVDHLENQFLKKVLHYCRVYIENHKSLFQDIDIMPLVAYCQPAFNNVSSNLEENQIKNVKSNIFFKEYAQAIELGNHILKRVGYNFSIFSEKEIDTPPYWINMPKLFELYVYAKLLEANSGQSDKIKFQFATYGNQLDILIQDKKEPLIIDVKYKIKYQFSHIHQDIRQVSGYARLRKIRDAVNVQDDSHIDCLIIYPDVKNGIDTLSFDNIHNKKEEITSYYRVYKLGVKIPVLKTENKSPS